MSVFQPKIDGQPELSVPLLLTNLAADIKL